MSVAEYAQVVATTTAALLGIATLLSRFIWRPMKNNIKSEIEAMLDDRLKPIEKATAQLLTNGGTHLADKVIRLEERQSGIANRLDDIFEIVSRLATKE
jgi:DNA topoisomerase VI subunit B